MIAAADALAAVRRDAGNIRSLITAAETLFRTGASEEAIALLREGVTLAPENAVAQRALSGFLVATGVPEAAEPHARRATVLAPAAPEMALHLAHVLFARRHHAAAVEPLLTVLGMQPDKASAWHMLSVALQQAGKFEKALEAVDRAITLAPEKLDYALHRAALLNARARHGDALTELRRACVLAPDDARAARALSGVLEVLGDIPGAHAEAERACALAPADAALHTHLAALAAQLGMFTAPAAPPGWEPPPPRRRAPPAGPIPLRARYAERGRIIWAVALREMRTRHSRSTLGYVWALLEPVSHLLTLGVMFAYVNRAPPPIGDSLFEFYCTGLLPYLLFAHVAGEVMHARAGGGALLLLPRVRTTDIMAAKTFVQLMTEITVAALVFAAFGLAGFRALPAHPLAALAALLLLAGLGLGIGALNLVAINFFPGWETVFNSVVRLLYFASGIYYTPISMPDAVRDALVWNPVLQGVELFRAGFYEGYAPFWLNTPYLLWCVAGALALGLTLEQAARRHLRRVA